MLLIAVITQNIILFSLILVLLSSVLHIHTHIQRL